MAKVYGPMFCSWGSGTFGKLLTYHNRKEGIVLSKKKMFRKKLPFICEMVKLSFRYKGYTLEPKIKIKGTT